MPKNQYGLGLLFSAKDKATATIHRVGQAMDRTIQSTKTMDKANAVSANKTKVVGQSMDKATSSVNALTNAERKNSNSTRRMGQTMDNTSHSAKNFDQSMQNAFFTISSGQQVMNKGIGVIKTFGSTIADYAKFEYALAAVQAKMGATTKDMKLLEQAAISAGVATQFSPTEAVEGLSQLAAKGLNARDAAKVLVPALDLAAAGQLSVGEATNALVGTMKSYNMQVKDAGFLTDRLMKITSITGLEAKDFQTALAGSAAAGAMYGQNINEVLVTLGLLRNANIGASRSMTAVREAMRRLATDPRSKRELKKYTEIYDAQTGKMRPILDITSDLIAATKHLSDEKRNEIATTIFGTRGAFVYAAALKASARAQKDGNIVTLQGIDAIQNLRDKLDGAKGTSKKYMETLHNTVTGQMILIKGTLQTISIMIGKSIGKLLLPVIKLFYIGLTKLVKIVRDMHPAFKVLVTGIGIFVGVILTAIGALTIFKGVGMLIGPVLGQMAVSFKAMMISLQTSAPVILAVAAAFFLLYKAWQTNWLGFRDGVKSFFEGFKIGLTSVINLFMDLWQVIKWVGGLLSPLATMWEKLWSSVDKAGSSKGLSAMQTFGKVVAYLVSVFLAFKVAAIAFKAGVIIARAAMVIFRTASVVTAIIVKILAGAFTTLTFSLLPIIGVILLIAAAVFGLYEAWKHFDEIKAFFGSAMDYVMAKLSVVGNFFKSIWTGIGNFFKVIISGIKTVWDTTFGAIKNAILWLWHRLKWLIDKIIWAKDKIAGLNPLAGGSGAVTTVIEKAKALQTAEPVAETGLASMMPIMPAKANQAPQVHVTMPPQAPAQIHVTTELDGNEIAKSVTIKQNDREIQAGLPTPVVTG